MLHFYLFIICLLFISMRDETSLIQQEKRKHKGDLRHFCLLMKNVAHKIKKLTYSRDEDFGFIWGIKYL